MLSHNQFIEKYVSQYLCRSLKVKKKYMPSDQDARQFLAKTRG